MSEFGPFWHKKMRTCATRLDQDEDGEITKKDIISMADRYAAYAQSGRGSEAKALQMRTQLVQV